MTSRLYLSIFRWLFAITALGGIVLVYRRWLHVNPTTVALTLLLFILVLAAEWGLRYAIVASIGATACFNFFFLPPIDTFTVADPQNWLALLSFLATSIIASRLSDRARDRTKEAEARQRELEILVRLSRELLQSESLATLPTSIPYAVASVTSARSGMLYMLDGDRLSQVGEERLSQIEMRHLRQVTTSITGARIDAGELEIPIRTGVRPRGLLILRGAILSLETAEAIGSLISLALDRAQALEAVARGEASKETERMRTLLIDSVTHELRTPLTSIKGAASALLTAIKLEGAEARELATIIDEESDRLNRLVSEAVEMAQLDANEVQMHFSPVGVRDLIEGARQSCAWIEETHPLQLQLEGHLMARADPGSLGKVLGNLLENAAKYSAAGTPITISAEEKLGEIAISVSDQGFGIDAAEQPLIFERFYRARSQSEAVSGTGMGLAISRAIVEAHGGSISVTSQVGHGSVFTFTVPAAS
jgi:two-component system sensor histidine kinase KdpD